jgi:DNA-binding transcriptional ArsR family regulator
VRHAKTFVKVSSLAAPEPQAEEVSEQTEVRDQQSEVSADPGLTSDLRLLTSGISPEVDVIDPVLSNAEGAEFTEAPDPAEADSGDAAGDVPEHVIDAEAVMGALLCANRQALLIALVEHGRSDVTTLAGRAGVAKPAASFHLGKLKLTGLVQYQRKGKRHLYAVTPGLVLFERKNGQLHLRANRPSGNGVTLHINDPKPRPAVAGVDPPGDAG